MQKLMKRLDRASINDWEDRASKACWRVKALANDCGLSPRSLQRFWKEEGRGPLSEWLAERRFRHACFLLRSKHISIEEVARQVHYQHLSAFSYAFVVRFGITPR